MGSTTSGAVNTCSSGTGGSTATAAAKVVSTTTGASRSMATTCGSAGTGGTATSAMVNWAATDCGLSSAGNTILASKAGTSIFKGVADTTTGSDETGVDSAPDVLFQMLTPPQGKASSTLAVGRRTRLVITGSSTPAEARGVHGDSSSSFDHKAVFPAASPAGWVASAAVSAACVLSSSLGFLAILSLKPP